MISLYRQDGDIIYGVKQFILDTPNDLPNLTTNCRPGSLAFVVSNSEYFMLNNAKEWISVTLGAGSGGGSVTGDDGGFLRMF